MDKTKLQPKLREEGSYVQLFAYKMPKQNDQLMVNLQKQLTSVYRNHGTLQSEFFRLGSRETFEGFVSIAKTVPTSPDEELWVELEYYRTVNIGTELSLPLKKMSAVANCLGSSRV